MFLQHFLPELINIKRIALLIDRKYTVTPCPRAIARINNKQAHACTSTVTGRLSAQDTTASSVATMTNSCLMMIRCLSLLPYATLASVPVQYFHILVSLSYW